VIHRSSNRALGYARVSTNGQAESGLGLDAQERAIRDAASKHGCTLAHVYTDAGASGSWGIDDRPALADALNALRRGDVLIVAKRDRLARDAFLAVVIEREAAKKGARVLSAAGEGTDADDPTSLFVRRILDAVSELERSLTAARTRAALRAKRARGQRAGAVPLGFRVNGDGQSLHVDDHEQRIVTVLRDCAAAGYSERATAAELNRLGLRTRAGSPWRHQYVRSALATLARHQ
jgi:DNA invertase Pin-like site-specific DNA recombinase